MDNLLLTSEERDEVANAVDKNSYETSAEYWDAIIDAELKAQRAKGLKNYEDEIPKEKRRRIHIQEELCIVLQEFNELYQKLKDAQIRIKEGGNKEG